MLQLKNWPIYIGMFLISCATLMYEILLTRIFSVTMWYHFAFLVVSVAMLGLTAGSILVFVFPNYFSKNIPSKLALFSVLFAVAAVFGVLSHINYDIDPQMDGNTQIWFLLTFLGATIPFVFSGVVISLIITKYIKNIGRIYAMDLAGAAIGCILVLVSLNFIAGPMVTLVIALLAILAANVFLINSVHRPAKRISNALLLLAFISIIYFQLPRVQNTNNLFDLQIVKGSKEKISFYEKWNSYSRIGVYEVEEENNKSYFDGTSRVRGDRYPKVLDLIIDGSAATPLINFTGNFEKLEFLKGDISNIGFYLTKNPKTMIIGAGGGKDVLSALTFGVTNITAVEINKNILSTLTGNFGDFTGHLDKLPGVKFVNDEARSFLASHRNQYDLIQISLIDTWAATSAGAYVLSENSLYTVEAWKVFLASLSEDGILSVTRWYFDGNPYEAYRLTALAVKSLNSIGVEDARRNVLLVKITNSNKYLPSKVGMATLLISKTSFDRKDIDIVANVSKKYGHELVLTPDMSEDMIFENIFTEDYLAISDKVGANILPPTDDSPFFFNMLRFKDLSDIKFTRGDLNSHNLAAVKVLLTSLILVSILCVIFIAVPLAFRWKMLGRMGNLNLIVYFVSIGVSFMLVEISLIQRLTVFLGHPSYGLSVLLFSLLLSTGMGSYFSSRYLKTLTKSKVFRVFFLLLLTLLTLGLTARLFTVVFSGSASWLRVILTILLITPAGFFMGTMFPIGMKLIVLKKLTLTTPWFWAVNGAASVYASVFAIVLALNYGISMTFWTGVLIYLIAILVVYLDKSAIRE